MNGLLFISVFLAPFPLSNTPGEAEGITVKDTLEGTWAAVAITLDGFPVTQREAKEFRLLITPDQLIFKWDGTRNVPFSYTLDPSKDPKSIDCTALLKSVKGEVCRGIYRLDKDELELCIKGRKGARPTEFASKPNTECNLFHLQHIKTER